MLGRVNGQRGEVDTLEEVEAQERREPLSGRRRLVDGVAAIGRRDRLTPRAPVRGQVRGGEEPGILEPRGNGPRHPAAVEEVGLRTKRGKGAGEVGLAKAL